MNKVLLIFGAGGSLGQEASEVLIEKNFDKVYLFASKKIEMESENTEYVQTSDLTVEDNVKAAFSKVNIDDNTQYFMYSTIGGFAGGSEIADMDFDEWNKMLNLNVSISFLLSKYFFILCKSAQGGSVCFTSAMTSLNTSEKKAAYGTSKSALNYLVKTLSKEGKNYNISVNAVAPLALDTIENREWAKDISMLIAPKEIGEVVFSLFSNRRIVSGNIIELPGTLN